MKQQFDSNQPKGAGQLQDEELLTRVDRVIAVSLTNPVACTPEHQCAGHEAGHQHGAACGHLAISHGDHTDYVVRGHLHHPHGKHCDNHGPVTVT